MTLLTLRSGRFQFRLVLFDIDGTLVSTGGAAAPPVLTSVPSMSNNTSRNWNRPDRRVNSVNRLHLCCWIVAHDVAP